MQLINKTHCFNCDGSMERKEFDDVSIGDIFAAHVCPKCGAEHRYYLVGINSGPYSGGYAVHCHSYHWPDGRVTYY